MKNELYYVSDYIKVYPGQKLYKSGASSGASNCFYDENKKFIRTITVTNGVISVPATNSINYIRVNGKLTDLDSVQITSGDTQSTYEAYIEPKIFILNNNNIYEEFVKNSDDICDYSIQEKIIGTWIDGTTLYRKVVTSNQNIGNNISISHGITNFKMATNFYAVAKGKGSETYKDNNKSFTLEIVKVNDNAIVANIANAFSDWDIYFILEYIKTTN